MAGMVPVNVTFRFVWLLVVLRPRRRLRVSKMRVPWQRARLAVVRLRRMPAVVAGVVAIPAVHEQHHQRAEQEYGVGEQGDDVRGVLRNQINRRKRQSSKQELSLECLEQELLPIQLLRVHIDLRQFFLYSISSRLRG